MSLPFVVTAASPQELLPALRVLCGSGTDGQAERYHDALRSGSHDTTGLFVARNVAGRACGALMVQEMPGALGLAWPPRGETVEIENALMIAACDWLRTRGVKVCQAFAANEELPNVDSLERNGFRHVTQLTFMRAELLAGASFLSSTSPLAFEPDVLPFSERFRSILLATHEGTQDCPELNGMRTADELLAGFTDAPSGTEWHLAIHDGVPVGVVILAPGTEPRTVELSYLGIVPPARGRGFGDELLKFAIAQAGSRGSALTLSVDARNEPALRLYRRQGFVETDHREVFLAQCHG